jgi:hypothetical protein
MYGYSDDPIAAQVQLYQYPHASDVGELDSLGDYLGQSDYGWAGELLSLVGTGIGVIGGAKGAADQKVLMQKEKELLEERGRILAQQERVEAAKTTNLILGAGIVALVGGIGVTVWQWPKISKKLGL